ncbi:MAG: glycosyltransferase family 2 protein [Candidatus Berkelbacteria bacterium]|nr:glycosyltransferase family 2 protein [Candidatus Berkelbacteria bacterium]
MPKHKIHLAIVIPVYNEGPVIRSVINSLPKQISGVDKITVLAVNDGSTDNSAKEIKKTKAVLVSHPINLGAGSATVTGLKGAEKIKADIAVTIDGDGQHDPKDIAKIIKPILQNKADIVIGTRLKKSKGMPNIKKVGNWGLNIITYALSRMWTSDSQSGFRAFSKKAISALDIESLGYEFCSEVLVEAKRQKLKIAEVPVRVIYTHYSKQKGQSIFNGMNIVIKLIIGKITKII